MKPINNVEMLQFCILNSFNNKQPGTTVTGITPKKFTKEINKRISANQGVLELSNEYPEICSHFFVSNDFTTTLQGRIRLPENAKVMSEEITRSGQEAIEKPYKTYWLDSKNITIPKAKWLDIILYSKEHLKTENIIIDADWGIVAILGTPILLQKPPTRAILERNQMGSEHGGNGYPATAEMFARADSHWYPTGPWIEVK